MRISLRSQRARAIRTRRPQNAGLSRHRHHAAPAVSRTSSQCWPCSLSEGRKPRKRQAKRSGRIRRDDATKAPLETDNVWSTSVSGHRNESYGWTRAPSANSPAISGSAGQLRPAPKGGPQAATGEVAVHTEPSRGRHKLGVPMAPDRLLQQAVA